MAAVALGNAANKAVAWTSSDPGVAAVSNGVVTPIAPGSAVLSVTTYYGGRRATCNVTVILQPQ